jgi:hypothetical protein
MSVTRSRIRRYLGHLHKYKEVVLDTGARPWILGCVVSITYEIELASAEQACEALFLPSLDARRASQSALIAVATMSAACAPLRKSS